MIHGGVSEHKIKTERSNQLLDEEGLFAKGTKDFTVQQQRREAAAAGRETSVGGRIQTTMPWHETPRRRKRGFSFLFWYSSIVRAQKPDDERVRLTTVWTRD